VPKRREKHDEALMGGRQRIEYTQKKRAQVTMKRP